MRSLKPPPAGRPGWVLISHRWPTARAILLKSKGESLNQPPKAFGRWVLTIILLAAFQAEGEIS